MASSNASAAKPVRDRTSQNGVPLFNAVLLSAALGLGVWILVDRGLLSWPPHRLMSSLTTVVGCVALCGPLVLLRRGKVEPALGELLWMVGGILVWLHSGLALLAGNFKLAAAPTPLSSQAMATVIGTVMIATWLLNGTGRSWTWTNILGWLLGGFWVGLGVASYTGALQSVAR